MVVIRVSSEEYEQELKKLNPLHAYNRPQFALLNNLWVDEIHFLLFKTSKVEFAITLGERNNVLLSPWSAPFGGFAFRDEGVTIETIEECVTSLKQYASHVNCTLIQITIPPSIYDHQFITKLNYVLEFSSSNKIVDINYHFNLHDISINDRLNRNFKRNLKVGEKLGMQLHLCTSLIEKEKVYSVIEENRVSQGYPLKMGFEQLLTTSKIINIDFFLLQDNREVYASAICYWVSEKIIQIIYWGDYPQKRGVGAMHQMSVQLREYYFNKSIETLDLGPASDKGVPNYGLCNFKETIGCEVGLKNSYTISIENKG